MKEWLDSLEQREKYVLLGGAVMLMIIVLWMFVIHPLYSGTAEKQQRIATLRGELVRATQLSSTIKSQQQNGGRSKVQSTNESMVILVQRSSRTVGLEINRSRPLDDNTVRVQLEGAPFDSLVNWMAALSTQYGVDIDIASLERTKTPGMVDAQLTLKRPTT